MNRLNTLIMITLAVPFLGVALPRMAAGDTQVRQLVGQWKMIRVMNGSAKLRVFTAGDGRAIVMLPGLGIGPAGLEPLAQRLLAGGFRVILPEPRGYGESTGALDGVTLHDLAGDVARAIEDIGGAPVLVAGHAYGDRVGRMLASDRPDLVRGVVVMAAAGKFPPEAEAAQNLMSYLDKRLPAESRLMAAKAALYGPESNPTRDDVAPDRISADTIKMQIVAMDPKLVPFESWWPGGKAPMLVIQGLADVLGPPETGRSLKADYPDRVTLVEVPGLGHAMPRVAPDLIAEAITAFARKLGN
jgi:pimeloyl-ACP methyl ester carboxylesterase